MHQPTKVDIFSSVETCQAKIACGNPAAQSSLRVLRECLPSYTTELRAFVCCDGHVSYCLPKFCKFIFRTGFPYQFSVGLGPQAKIFCAGALCSAYCSFRTQKVGLNCLVSETGDTQRQNCLQKLKRPSTATAHDRLHSKQAAKEAATHF